MKMIEKTQNQISSFGVALEASASELTQGGWGWKWEKYDSKSYM